MAEKLAKLYGTEDDKVNCPFYYKIGACRYEHKCMRIHNRPPYSQTILLKHMYENTPIELAIASGNQVSEEDTEKAISRFEEFY
jgi:splicing factor U2AF subunit